MTGRYVPAARVEAYIDALSARAWRAQERGDDDASEVAERHLREVRRIVEDLGVIEAPVGPGLAMAVRLVERWLDESRTIEPGAVRGLSAARDRLAAHAEAWANQ